MTENRVFTERYVGVIAGYGNTLGTCASWIGPQLVASDTGLGLAWLRVTTGFRADLFTRRVDAEGTTLTAGAEAEVPTTGDVFAPYGIDMVHIGDDVFFLTWVQGESVDGDTRYEVAGRFVQL